MADNSASPSHYKLFCDESQVGAYRAPFMNANMVAFTSIAITYINEQTGKHNHDDI